MASFTINQDPDSQNLLLYPNGNYHSGCTAYPPVENYLNVDDPYDISDDDISYNWMMGASTVTDMYQLDDTAVTGTINYVKIFAKAKSYLYGLGVGGYYRILANHSGVTSRQNCTLTTDYNIFSYLLTSTPSGGAWNWTAINALKIGWDAYSPSYIGPLSLILRPDSNGDFNQSEPFGDTPEYACVDDVTPDDDETYTYNTAGSGTKYDQYNSSVVTLGLGGTINDVVVYWRGKKTIDYTVYISPITCVGASTEYGGFYALTTSYADYSETKTTNPSGGAWTWTDINALQFGYRTYLVYALARITQCYAVVNYSDTIYPKIRTTQEYVMVNYTPSTISCYLNMPTDYDFESQYELQKKNWWNNTRTTRMLCRSSKTVSLRGLEYLTATSTPTVRLHCVEQMKDNGATVTISGLIDPNLNTTWLIKSFSYVVSDDNPNLWEWNMTLEKDR